MCVLKEKRRERERDCAGNTIVSFVLSLAIKHFIVTMICNMK
jgi:hypothetical protein